MANDTKLVNRVANSKLKVINLEHYFPDMNIIEFDLKDFLYKDFILKEKEFRTSLEEVDWEKYKNSAVAIHCSSDAIIPTWGYMLVASYLEPYAERINFGNKEKMIESEYSKRLDGIDFEQYRNELIVIKGCGNKSVPVSAYVELTAHLRPYARSIMYGEACSTVPIYKKTKNSTS